MQEVVDSQDLINTISKLEKLEEEKLEEENQLLRDKLHEAQMANRLLKKCMCASWKTATCN